MVIDPLPLTADAQTWQAIAREQHSVLIYKEALIAKLTAQIAQLKRLQFAAKAESFNPEQRQLFEEALAEELASLTSQLNKALPTEQPTVKQPLNASRCLCIYHEK